MELEAPPGETKFSKCQNSAIQSSQEVDIANQISVSANVVVKKMYKPAFENMCPAYSLTQTPQSPNTHIHMQNPENK